MIHYRSVPISRPYEPSYHTACGINVVDDLGAKWSAAEICVECGSCRQVLADTARLQADRILAQTVRPEAISTWWDRHIDALDGMTPTQMLASEPSRVVGLLQRLETLGAS